VVVDQAGHNRRFANMGDETYAEVVYVPGLAMRQGSGYQPLEAITCASANVDYSGASLVTSADVAVHTTCTQLHQVAIGQATTSAVGTVHNACDSKRLVRYDADNSAHNVIHVRTLATSGVVYVSRLGNP